jgi:magnesium transporter
MSVLPADLPRRPGPDQSEPSIRVRVIYRDSGGQIHFDWPVERVREAVDDTRGIVWVDIEDLDSKSNASAEALLRDVFQFHPLAIEDALKETHVPKVDDWCEYLYIVFHSIDFDPEAGHVRLHELDIFLGRNYLVTYHTEPLRFLDQDRRNIERDPVNRMRHGADHLLYHFLDLAVAEYLPAIEHLDDAIDDAQEEVFRYPTPKTLQAIFRVKRSALRLHRILMPEREVLNRLARDSYDPIDEGHRVYFRDVYDHTVRVLDLTESLRDLISGALDTYLSAISNRTNDIMKTLTIVTVMFLPMSFLSGFFGMNYFGETLAFQTPLPRALLFTGTCLIMVVTFWAPWLWARRRGWF